MIDTLVDTEQETTSDFGEVDTLVLEGDDSYENLFIHGKEFILTSGITQLTPWVAHGPGRYRARQIRCEAVRKKI